MLLENAKELLIKRMGAGEIGAERLFDDDTPPRAVFPCQTRLAEMTTNRSEPRRRCCQIKQPIALCGTLAFDAGELPSNIRVSGFVVGVALHITDAAEHLVEHVLIDRSVGELGEALGEVRAKRFA